MQEALSPQEFDDKYGEYLLDGLSSTSTYIPLKTNSRLGINIAIRPYVIRDSRGVVLFGGKLRVGYTRENGQIVTTKITALNDEARVEQLRNFCKGFKWQKQSGRRFSTVVGIAVAAGRYDGEVVDQVIETKLAQKLIDSLESKFSQYNDDQSFNAKRKAAGALEAAWLIQAQKVFQPMPEAEKMSPEALGTTSKVLNKAQDGYHDNVVSFQQKVEELNNAE